MTEQGERAIGTDFRALGLEQYVLCASDHEVTMLASILTPIKRKAIKIAAENAYELRDENGQLDIQKVERQKQYMRGMTDKERIHAADFLSVWTMNPEALEKLGKAVSLVEAFEQRKT